jgi:hypothetical protein
VKGEPEVVDEARAKKILQAEDFELQVNLGLGGREGEAKYWTCDFSYVSFFSSQVFSYSSTLPLGICQNKWRLSYLNLFVLN